MTGREPGLAHRAVTMAVTTATGLDRTVSRGKRAHVRSKASTADGSQQRIGMSRASVTVAAAPATAGGAGGPGGRPVRVRQAPSNLDAYEHRAGVVPKDSSEAVLRQLQGSQEFKVWPVWCLVAQVEKQTKFSGSKRSETKRSLFRAWVRVRNKKFGSEGRVRNCIYRRIRASSTLSSRKN